MKRALSIILAVLVMVCAMPVSGIASSAEDTGASEEKEVFYSDLFYGYSYYIKNSSVLSSYYENNYKLICDISSSFYNSDTYKYSFLRETINTAASFPDFIRIISDAMGFTDFTYEAALDSANVILAQQLIGRFEGSEVWGNAHGIADLLKDLSGVFLKLEDSGAIAGASDSEIVQDIISGIKAIGRLSFIPSDQLSELTDYFVENESYVINSLELGATVYGAAKVWSTALALENLRFEAISAANAKTPEGSITRAGLNRLLLQAKTDFKGYFVDNYINKALLGSIEKVLVGFIELKGAADNVNALQWAMGLLKVVSLVVFDAVMDVPTIDELTTQLVLCEYVKDLYTSVKNRVNVFSTTQFKTSEIKAFEKTFEVFSAAVDAALLASEHISGSLRERLSVAKSNYYGRDMYTAVINQGLHTLKITPEAELIKTNYGDWNYPLKSASDFPSAEAIYCPRSGINANIAYYNGGAPIEEGEIIVINGNLYVGKSSYSPFDTHIYFKNYGDLTVNGDLQVFCSSARWSHFLNYGTLRVKNISQGKTGGIGGCEDAVWYVSGNTDVYYSVKVSLSGTLILNGTAKQTMRYFTADTIIITNESDEGIIFNSAISPKKLFNHNGNNFTCNYGATFVDYDGDGMKDNVDPQPTVGNPCNVSFLSNNSEFGSVSSEGVSAIGGSVYTVAATPSSKYRLEKWVDSEGNTLSLSEEYTFVIKKDDTITAVFEKRTQPISAKAQGGAINAPQSAEIESVVEVSVTENEGYVYTPGSLSYNGIMIENGSFIMPDEPVTLTAEFLPNNYYSQLKETIASAETIGFEEYSKESFASLAAAIKEANAELKNDVSRETAERHITSINEATNALKPKFITTIEITKIPTLYIGLEDRLGEFEVIAHYDNSTSQAITDFTLSGIDINTAGSYTVTAAYEGFTAEAEVSVILRPMGEVSAEGIADVVFTGPDSFYEPKPALIYTVNSELLTEGIDYTLSYRNNTSPGAAVVIVSGIGRYEGEKELSFKLYCEHEAFTELEYIAPTCLENGYRLERCNTCGVEFERHFKRVFTSDLPQSKHNYDNYTDKTYTYSVPGAEYLILSFSSSSKIGPGDYIYVYDAYDELVKSYYNCSLSGLSLKVEGESVKIRLKADGSGRCYGFSFTSIEAHDYHTDLEALGHTESDWEVKTEPSVFSEGLKVCRCTACGEVIAEQKIPKLIFYGDADLSGAVDANDLAALRKSIIIPPQKHNAESDVNGDGAVNILDIIRLKKYLAGYDVKLG